MAAPDENQTLPGTDRRAAIVGAGPSGFYAADQLLKQGFEVDLLRRAADAVRPGALRRRARPPEDQVGHAGLREDRREAGLPLLRRRRAGRATSRAQDLLERYHAVVYAFGTADDNRLGIPGEDRPGSHSATALRGLVQRPPARRRRRVRPLVRARGGDRQRQRRDRRRADARARPRRARADRHRRPRDRGVRRRRRSQEVVLLGRRGPAQAAFTNPELRELGELQRADVVVEPPTWSSTPPARAGWPRTATRPRRRNVEHPARLRRARPPRRSRTGIALRFLRSPVEILGEGEDGPVTGVRVALNRIEAGATAACARCHRRGGGHRVRPGAALDRLPRPPGGRAPVRRAPRPDPQRGRPRLRRGRRAAHAASTSSAGSSAGPAA